MKQLDSTGLKRLHRGWRREAEGRLALILDSVQQPFNVGSIIRSAACYRVDEIWAGANTPSPAEVTQVGKTSRGTERYLTWHDADRTLDAIAAAKAAGYRVLALELADGALPMHEADLSSDVCLVIGNEDHGVSAGALAACDGAVYLPQLGKVGSLNASVATAIACYEVRRSTWTA